MYPTIMYFLISTRVIELILAPVRVIISKNLAKDHALRTYDLDVLRHHVIVDVDVHHNLKVLVIFDSIYISGRKPA